MAKARMMTLDLTQIVLDDAFQMREGLDEDHVDDICRALKKKAGSIERIKVMEIEGVGMVLTSGHYRVAAHKKAGLKTIQAQVRKGSRLDATKEAMSSNLDHLGLKPNRMDRRRGVRLLLERLSEAKEVWSNRKVADFLDVSDHLVADVLLEMGGAPKKPTPRKVVEDLPDDPDDEPAGVDMEGWENTPIEEGFNLDPDMKKSLDKAGIKTAGQFMKAIDKMERIGLSIADVKEITDWVDDLKKNEERPAGPTIATPQGGIKGFDWSSYETHLGYVVRGVDTIAKAYPGEKGSRALESLFETITEYEKWWHKLRLRLDGEK